MSKNSEIDEKSFWSLKTLLLLRTCPNKSSCKLLIFECRTKSNQATLIHSTANAHPATVLQPKFYKDNTKVKPKLQKAKQSFINWLDTNHQLSIILSLYLSTNHVVLLNINQCTSTFRLTIWSTWRLRSNADISNIYVINHTNNWNWKSKLESKL